ncbi:MAG: YIP1 family protein [Vicinamibacterales bacterium]
MSENEEGGWPPVPPSEPAAGAPGRPPDPPPGETSGPPPLDVRTGPPWEAPGPWFSRLVDTVRLILFKPSEFFRTLNLDRGLGAPLVFYLITGAIGSIFTAGYQLMLQTVNPPEQGVPAILTFTITLVVLPALLVIAVFAGSGIYHLMLMLLGGRNRPYEATFRVIAYSAGATSLVAVLPFCGGFIGALWQVVLAIMGLAETHRISVGKAAAAVLLPALACCLVLVFFFFTALTAFMALAGLDAMR